MLSNTCMASSRLQKQRGLDYKLSDYIIKHNNDTHWSLISKCTQKAGIWLLTTSPKIEVNDAFLIPKLNVGMLSKFPHCHSTGLYAHFQSWSWLWWFKVRITNIGRFFSIWERWVRATAACDKQQANGGGEGDSETAKARDERVCY